MQVTDWVDLEDKEQEKILLAADRHIADYRSMYDPAEVEAGGEAAETYKMMERLYEMKEAAKISTLYGEFISELIRDHEDMVGFSGGNMTVKEGDMDAAQDTLLDYGKFLAKIQDKDVRRKTENELGRKIIFLKMVLSAENFSAKFGCVAGGDFIPHPQPQITEK